MGANRPRRHHFVPEMLLRNFCDDEGGLWVGDQMRGNCYRSAPRNVFVRKDLYTSHVWNDGTDSYEHEHALSRVESGANDAILSVIQQARDGCNPRLDPELDRKLKEFVIAMARRTPESQERIFRGSGRTFEETFDNVAKVCFEQEGREVPDLDFFDRHPGVLRIKQIMKANHSAKLAAGEHDILREDSDSFVRQTGWRAALICLPNRSFVIGSHGLTVIRKKDALLEGSWLPIAHDVAIQMTGFPGRGLGLRLDRREEPIIKALNTAAAAQSEVIAGRSKALVRSLTARSNRRT